MRTVVLILAAFSLPSWAFHSSNRSLTINNWVIFQAFDWDSLSDRGSLYTTIDGMAVDLSHSGINAVWFPPTSQSIDKQGYLPQQW